MTELPEYGAVLREARHRSGLTLATISKLMYEQGRNIHANIICGIETGKHRTSPGNLAAYANVVGVDPIHVVALFGRIYPPLEDALTHDAEAQRIALRALGMEVPSSNT